MVEFRPSPLEERILRLYSRHGIHTPGDISLHVFDRVLPIRVIYRYGAAVAIDTDYEHTVFVDGHQSLPERRVKNAHEIGHLLLHSGIHPWMPPVWHDKQEWQTTRFAMYSLAPSHMLLKEIRGEEFHCRGAMVASLAEIFCITESFMDERLLVLEQQMRGAQ